MTREDRRVRATDGTSLRVGVWRPEGTPRFCVMILHGQGEHIARHAWVAEPLARAGGLVFGHDHRGEGQSGGRRGHVESFLEYEDDAAVVAGTVLQEAPADVPRILFAHSMGALIGLGLLVDHPEIGFRAAVISSPLMELAMEVGPLKRALARVANVLAPKLPIPAEIPPEDVAGCPEIRKSYASDPDRTLTVTPRWAAAMEAAQSRVAARVHRIEIPMYWYQGTADKIVRPEATQRAFASLPHAKERDQVLELREGVRHESHNEPAGVREAIREKTVAWILDQALTE